MILKRPPSEPIPTVSSHPTTDPSVPPLRTLYWNDPIFRKAVSACSFALFVSAGIWWYVRPMPNADPAVVSGPEMALMMKAPPYLLGFAGLAFLAAAWRYFWVKSVFTDGETIQGTVVELTTDTWESTANRDQSHGTNKITNRTYHATVRYTVGGEERTVRLRLPHAASNYGMKQGGPVELMVSDSSPGSPLVRAVYLERVRMKWFF